MSHWYRWKGKAIVVPDVNGLRQDILISVHDAPLAGHFGVAKTTQLAERMYWWPTLRKDVLQYVRTCDCCQRNKSSTQKPAGKAVPLQIPGKRWESVSMDLITKLPSTKSGNDAIIVYVDRLSKMVHFRACTTKITAVDLADYFLQDVIRLHGIPAEIMSDRDSKFTSTFWKAMCSRLKIQQCMSTSFHPQTDGQTERVNRVLEEVLRHYVSPAQDDWDRLLPAAEFAVNNAWHASTQATPFELNYGDHPVMPEFAGVDTGVPKAEQYTTLLQNKLKRTRELLRGAQERQAVYANRRRSDLSFEVGDRVLLSTKHIRWKTSGTPKLLPRRIGPFKVLEKIGKVAYKLELPHVLKIHDVFHVSVLSKYHTDGRLQPPPPPIEADEDGEVFAVEQVLKHKDVKRGKGTKRYYLIKWLGYPPEYNQWEPQAHLTERTIESYWAGNPVEAGEVNS